MRTLRRFILISFWIIFCMSAIRIFSAPEGDKMIELILDASGSMNGKLSSGETKIEAAKKAVKNMVEKIPESVSLAFRAYGHQSHRSKKDCEDTQLLIKFSPVQEICHQVVATSGKLTAQGYTPITYVLTQASEDFPKDFKGEKMIILVSDGKETCQGDPCALAASLARSGAKITIHAVGFGVDSVTRGQLDCIASATGGKFFNASSTEELIKVLSAAMETAALTVEKKQGLGFLQVVGADLSGHEVTNAETGEKMEQSPNHVQNTVELPAGIYNVTVGNAVWKSVEVKTGEKTVLEPGWLSVEKAWIKGHQIKELETGKVHGSVSSLNSTVALIPGQYQVMFGEAAWPVTVEKGKKTILKSGTVSVKYAYIGGHKIFDDKGNKVGSVSATQNWMPLPPGKYTIEIDNKSYPFSLKEGEEVKFERK